MSAATQLSEVQEAHKNAMEEYPAPAIVKDQALVKDWAAERNALP